MKTEDRRLILHYLNNVLKKKLSPKMREDVWEWAEGRSQELFRLNLERLGEQAAEAIEGPKYRSRRRSNDGRIMEAKIRLLKKAAAKLPADPGRGGQICELSEKIADAFRLRDAERDVLRLFVAAMSLPALDDLLDEIVGSCWQRGFTRRAVSGFSLLLDCSDGKIERAFGQQSPLMNNGLFSLDDDGEISISEPLKKMVNNPSRAGRDLKSLVLEKKTAATLTRADFDYINITHEKHYDHMVELLRKALKKGDKGINILFYGPPGTGKTELAKTLAAEAEADLYPVSETSTANRKSSRLAELQMARTLVSGDPRAVLMMDEAEDVFGDVHSMWGGFFMSYAKPDESGSKLFLNRMLEKNETPVIWIANKVRSFDERHLRRFSYALELKTPPVPVRARIWRNELARKKIKMTEKEIGRLAKNYELPPSFAVSAIRAAKLTGDKGAIERTLNSLDYAITGRLKVIREENKADFNPALMNTNKNLSVVTEEVLNRGSLRFSLCLYGAPGTGKSEYARHLAERMGLEVLHKRASDILSMWVGEAEKNIAAAFQEAWTQKKFLIFDEADSLLQDRKLAHRSWEISQVNEMLNWMECHPYPFACTTNRMDSLDEACLRRLTYKVKYDFLTRDQARLAFSHFFGQDFEVKLDALTPGDFAVVARQAEILGLSDPAQLAELLAQEQEAKGVKSAGVGFLS